MRSAASAASRSRRAAMTATCSAWIDLQVAAAPDGRGAAEAHEVAQAADDGGQPAVPGGGEDDLVEARVVGHEGVLVAVVGERRHRVELALEGVEVVVGQQRAGAVGGRDLEEQAQREDLLEIVHGGLEHAHAAIALEAHHALALEQEQRLAHRGARDAEALGQPRHRIALARRQTPVDDGSADRVVGAGGQRRVVERQALQRAFSMGGVRRAQS